MPRKAHLAAWLAAVAVVAGCSPQEKATPDAAPAASASASDAALVDDPPGIVTCRRLATAVSNATLLDPGVIEQIVAASETADAPVADAALRLSEAYTAARLATGGPGEPDAIAKVSAAAVDMSNVCADSGLASIG